MISLGAMKSMKTSSYASSTPVYFIKHLKHIIALTALLSLCSSLYAQEIEPIITPGVPNIDAEAYILIDVKSGKVLAEKEANVKRDPASLTKMMTSYVVSENILSGKIKNSDIVTTSKNAWAGGNPILKGSSLMFLKPGDNVSVADLNRGIIIQSGNDACIAMAEYVAGSEDAFVSLMNIYAEKLGLKDTHFETVHGLDSSGQYTTARDMAELGKAIYLYHPDDYGLYKEKEFTYNNIKQSNRNGLLWDQSLNVDGIKTGHTNAAGYNLVASAYQGETRLISVVLGGRTFKGREAESKKLLTWGFRFFESYPVAHANTPIIKKRIWYGKTTELALGSLDDVYISIPRGQSENVTVEYSINNKNIQAPVKKGDHIGTMHFSIGDSIIDERPLVALQDVNKAGIFGTIIEFFKFKIYSWLN